MKVKLSSTYLATLKKISRTAPVKVLIILTSLYLFMLGLVLLTESTVFVIPLIRDILAIDTPMNALGFGWLFATLALSGSPVAATSLALLNGDALTPLQSLGMITGSRLGAASMVLVLGLIYIWRGHHKNSSLSAGILSLLVTQTIYIPAMVLCFLFFDRLSLITLNINSQFFLADWMQRITTPIIRFVQAGTPTWMWFPMGFLILVGSFALFDRGLPDLHLDESAFARVNRILYRPLASFILGAVVTLLAMSVSLSLSLLVPLSARGYIRQENIIPYVMGANITTLVDTLLAAALLQNPAALNVILAQILSVALISLLILVFSFRPYVRGLVQLNHHFNQHNRSLILYILSLLVIPLILILVG